MAEDNGGTGGEQQQQQQGGTGAQELGGGGQAPEWLTSLPEELRGDKTLSRYQNVEALARGHIEQHKVAKSKLAVPAADAPPEAWNAVWEALGRPAEAKAYEIPLPEGVTEESPMAAAFREKAFELGLLPNQVKGAVEFFNGQMNAAQEAYLAEGKAEIDALKAEMGADYEPAREAAKKVIAQFFDIEDVDLLDQTLGSGKLMRGAMKLAKAAGEHGRVDGEGEGGFGGAGANAEEQLKALQKDKSWRDKLEAGDVAVVAQRDRLLKAAQQQALKGGI